MEPQAPGPVDEKGGVDGMDVVQAVAPGEEKINLCVTSQDGSCVYFTLKVSTPLSKLMSSYCERQSLNPANIRFLYDGVRLRGDSTPKSLDMVNDDMIDACIAQLGG